MPTEIRFILTQARYQLISIARNRRAVILTLAFPVVLLVMFDSIFVGAGDSVELAGTRVTAQAYFTGGMLAYAIMLSGFSQLGIVLVTQRENGLLKRLRGTPVPAWTFIVATVLRTVVTVGAMAVVLLAIARIAYDVELSGQGLADILLYVVLGTATMCSLGIAATSIATDAESASAALPLTAVMLSLISGIFVSIDQLPGWLEESPASSPSTTSRPGCSRRSAWPARRSTAAISPCSRSGRWRGSRSRQGGSAGSRRRRPRELMEPDRLDPALLKLAGIVLVGAVAVQLDATIVNVAIDTLGRDLHAGLSTIQWVSTGYLLALAMVIPLTGWSVGPLRRQADVDALARAVPRRLGALRRRLVGREPDRVPRRAGHRRRTDASRCCRRSSPRRRDRSGWDG